MGRRTAEMRNAVAEELDLLGIRERTFDKTGGGHQKVIFTIGGVRRTIFFPSTSSDRRAVLNQRCLVRRKVAEWLL